MGGGSYIWLIGDILWCTFDFTQGMYGRSLLDFIQICSPMRMQKKAKMMIMMLTNP